MNALTSIIEKHLKKSGLWSGGTLAELSIQPLTGGTNHVFLLTMSAQQFVIKIPKLASQPLIDRSTEYHANELTAQAGISIPFSYFDLDSGVNIAPYQMGNQILTPELMQQDTVWQAVVRLLQKLHNLSQPFRRDIPIFTAIDFYQQRVAGQLPEEMADLSAWDTWLTALQAEFSLMQIHFAPCHGDALLSNFLLTPAQIYLIDWEYAGNNDPCWDLATVAANAEYTPAQEQRFLNTYFHDALDTPSIRRYHVYKVLADYLWALWCVTMDDEKNAILRWRRFQENAADL